MTSLSLLVLKTHQMENVRRFYAALDVDVEREKHDKGPIHFAGQLGPLVFEIYPLSPDKKADANTRLGIKVDDLSQVLETLVAEGIIGRTEPQETEWGLQVVIRDPDGRAVELTQSEI